MLFCVFFFYPGKKKKLEQTAKIVLWLNHRPSLAFHNSLFLSFFCPNIHLIIPAKHCFEKHINLHNIFDAAKARACSYIQTWTTG